MQRNNWRSWFFLLVLVNQFFGLAQSPQSGFFGKKNVISIDGVARGMLLYNMTTANYGYNKGTSFNNPGSKSFFAGGFSTSFTHYFNRKYGLGVEFNMMYNKVKTPNHFSYYINENSGVAEYLTSVETINMRTMYILPKLEWSNMNGNLPIGFINSVGIGYFRSIVPDKNYKQVVQQQLYSPTFVPPVENKTFKGSSVDTVSGIVVQYGIKLRIPITKYLALNFGSNFRLHLLSPVGYQLRDRETLEEQIRSSMKINTMTYFMDVNGGISFILF